MMRRIALLLALAVGLTACREESPTDSGLFTMLPVRGDTATGSGSAAELRLMRNRWADARDGRDYRYATFYTCFCGPGVQTLVNVRVSGSEVVEVREAASGATRPAAHYFTIEELFANAIALRERGGRVRVTYALDAGYPVWIEIGTPENDAGVTYFIRGVELER